MPGYCYTGHHLTFVMLLIYQQRHTSSVEGKRSQIYPSTDPPRSELSGRESNRSISQACMQDEDNCFTQARLLLHCHQASYIRQAVNYQQRHTNSVEGQRSQIHLSTCAPGSGLSVREVDLPNLQACARKQDNCFTYVRSLLHLVGGRVTHINRTANPSDWISQVFHTSRRGT